MNQYIALLLGCLLGWRFAVALGVYRAVRKNKALSLMAAITWAVIAFFGIPIGMNVQ